MFLDIYNNNGVRYIRISESYRVEVNGVRVARKRQIKNIGPVFKFDDGKPDFEQRLKDSFKACQPLIEELRPYVKKDLPKEIYHLDIHAGTEDCFGHPKLFASCLFDRLFEDLGLRMLVSAYKNYDGLNYDVLGFVKSLIYGRLLQPSSKIATVRHAQDYYVPLLDCDVYEYNMNDALDFIYNHKNVIFNRLDSSMREHYGRTTNRIFYDVTNFFFDVNDADRIDEDGQTSYTGLRQFGVSKEERRLPIVQMGLLMDEQGYPISIEVFKGNTMDHLTLIPSFENAPESTKNSRYIFVSDKGIGCAKNPSYAIANGNGYIVSKSIRRCKTSEKQWILDQTDYTVVSDDFKIKSRVYEKEHTLEGGTIIKSSEKQVVYWSRSFYERAFHEKKDFYELLKKILENPSSFRISKLEAGVLGKYIKKQFLNRKTGELIQSKDLQAMLDLEAIKNEYNSLGYYSIVTSETMMNDREIIDTYSNLVRIEDEFRIMKSTIETRPIYVRKPEHIAAHLTVCTIALLFLRIIQNKVKSYLGSSSNSYGLSAERIRDALLRWQVEKLTDEYYRFNNIDDPDLKLIIDSFGISIEKKLFRIKELKHIKQTINSSM